MNEYILKILSVLMAVFLCIGGVTVMADCNTVKTDESLLSERKTYLSEVLSENNLSSGKDVITINAADSSDLTDRNKTNNLCGNPNTVLLWDEDLQEVSWNFNIETEGLYVIKVKYLVCSDSGNNAVRSIEINGEKPFFEADNITFARKWQDVGDVRVNSVGDEVRPDIEEIKEWQEDFLYDSMGYSAEPLIFPLYSGSNIISLEYISQTMAIDTIKIEPYEPLADYDTVSRTYTLKRIENYAQVLQAEDNTAYKNDATVRMECDDDPSVVPEALGYRVLNTVGGYRWRNAGQSVTFSFDVPKDGLYELSFRFAQTWNDGLPVYRSIEVDGEIPFSELSAYRFDYSTTWQTETLGNKKQNYLFELKKGKHTVTMTVVLGEYSELVQSLYDDMTLLSEIVNSITRLAGNDPDPNYDYKFFKYIPELEGNLKKLVGSLEDKYSYIAELSGKSTSMGSNFSSIAKQIKSMLEDPFSIAKRLNQLVQAQTSLSNWYLTLQSLPLLIDEFAVSSPDTEIVSRKANIFQRLRTVLVNFIISFSKDYNGAGSIVDDSVEITDSIDVWVARGTEWAETIKELADENFTPESGTLVNIRVVPSSQLNSGSANVLLLSILSGNAPDVALGVSSGSPVEFAIRNAVVDLTEFSDFKDFSQNFNEKILIPFGYRGGVYAIPETMNFTCLFYRKDLLADYDIKIPETRDELYNVTLPMLYQNGMQYYQTHDFSQFLYQHGGAYYTDDGLKSALGTDEAQKAFTEYTQMFTHYGSPVSASFFNRFRTGEMPMGIGNYSLYIQLSTSAPELEGIWGIAPIPGRVIEDGSIDSSWSGIAAECDMIIAGDNESNKHNLSWEFLKWWMSYETQLSYAREIEALVGVEARWNTANVKAFLSLDWGRDDIAVFESLWETAKETPVVLGGYYTSRYLTNAFTDVVVSGTKTSYEALEDAVKEINRELMAKQVEYGVESDE